MYLIKRIVELGPKETFKRITNRIEKKLFILKFKRKALEKRAFHTWQQIQKAEQLDCSSGGYFESFFEKLKLQKTFLPQTHLDEKQILQTADNIANNSFHTTNFGSCSDNIQNNHYSPEKDNIKG